MYGTRAICTINTLKINNHKLNKFIDFIVKYYRIGKNISKIIF